jgi:hypothetical protein
MNGRPPRPAGRSDVWMLGLAAVVAAWFYFGTAMEPSTPWFTREPSGYYGLQTAGFRAGQLAAAIAPQPALLALKDPYDPVANAPYRVHDMTLYRGHYYLYFGASPILLVFWPCAALTGWYPSEPLVVAAFCTCALWLGLAMLGAVRRRYFPGASSWVLGGGAACLLWANPLTQLVQGPQFYQVATAGAIFLQMAMLAAVYRCLHSERRGTLWLALASLLFGLDVGARPSYLPGGLALVVAGWGLTLRVRPGFRLRRLCALLPAAALPAAACGAAIMLYNWLRFQSPFEFGLRYQLAGESLLRLRPIEPRLLLPHLHDYLFGAGAWSDYFPFFDRPAGQPYGFLRYLPWGWLALGALVPGVRSPSPAEAAPAAAGLAGPGTGVPAYRGFIGAVLAIVLGNLLLLASYFYTVDRYACDFTTTWLLLAGIGALALSACAAGRSWRGVTHGLLGVLAVGSVALGLAVFAAHAHKEGPLLALARAANWPGSAWRRGHGRADGALRVALELSRYPRSGDSEPVFETGRSPSQRDWLQIDYLPDHRARVSFHHTGMPVFPGEAFALPTDGRLVIEARCGSLLPPFDDPAFIGWSRDAYEAAKRDLQVRVNGTECLRGLVYCFDSSPSDLTIGRLAWPADGVAAKFSGRILALVREPPQRVTAAAPALRSRRPVILTLRLPRQHGPGGDPILVTGYGTHSDLVYCRYEGDGRIRFALDHFGGGGPQSQAFAADPAQPHRLMLWMGSLAEPGAAVLSPSAQEPAAEVPWSRRLVILFDGHTLINTEQWFYPGSPETALVGVNPYGSTTAGRQFEGRVEQVTPADFVTLPPLGLGAAYGAVDLTLEFPWNAAGRTEPLVVSGATGAGDFIYVKYVDSHHLAIGFDHWGIGGIVGPPLEIDYAQAHRISLTMGSLYPPVGDPGRRSLVRVTIDGRVALEGQSPCYRSTSEQIRIGVNAIGGSTCGPVFSGRFLSIERSADSSSP